MSQLSFPLQSAFLALPLEGQPKWQFQAIVEELKPYRDILRFQNPQSPHLTLYFWKELLKIEYDQIIPQAEKIAAKTSPFQLHVNGSDTFGKPGEERVLFLTVAFSPELATLKKLCPWPNPPDQPFHAHITIARINHPQKFTVHKKKIMKVLEGIEFDVPVSLMRFYAEINDVKQTPLHDFSFS
jgi:2'-5' RNA ligase